MTIPISGGVLPRLLRLSLLAAGVASLLATGSDPQGPPPPPPQSCAATVNSGFSGALDWVAGDTGVGAGADGEGGVGIQVSLGVSPVVGAVVTVRKADGTTLGSAPTGSDGRVTLKACDTAGPFLVEAQGVSGATYFDAAVRPAGARVAFGAGTSMRAVVPALSANIGVTPWTEAVVQRLLGASKPAPGPLPSASAIDEAHRYVRDNAYSTLLPDALGIDSLTLLPATTSSATLADSASDRYALALAALGEVAAMFNASLPTPALSAAQQFAVDAADGRIDGRAADGSAVASVGQLAYAAGTLRQSLDVGLAVAASRYATSALQDRLPATLALGAVSLPDGSGTSAQRAVRLGRDGSVVLLDADGSAGAAISSDAVALYGASQTPASALFVRRWDGTVVALGDGGPAGLLGLGAGMKLATATEVAALRDVTSISVGTAHALARKSDGGVLGWGDAGRGGLLGVTSGVV
ncbi:MAG: RCC1 domain-containing protein, partial [Rubrivivax sp.]